MTVEIKEIVASEFMRDNKALIREHMLEVGMMDNLEPDTEKYEWLESQGVLYTLGVFKDEVPIGYCSMLIAPHPHNTAILCASNDAIYLKPKYRGFYSGRLIKAVEESAKARGAGLLMWSAKRDKSLHKTLINDSYDEIEVILTKAI